MKSWVAGVMRRRGAHVMPLICSRNDLLIRPLLWRHNGHDGVSNHQPHDCLFNRWFRHRWKKTSKLRVTGLCQGNSPGPVNSPHKGSVTRKMLPFDDVIMCGRRDVTKSRPVLYIKIIIGCRNLSMASLIDCGKVFSLLSNTWCSTDLKWS